MKCVVYTPEQLNNHYEEMKKILTDGKFVNLSYDKSAKQKTKEQLGFIFGALIAQIKDFVEDSGEVVSENSIKEFFYEEVSKFIPEMVEDSWMTKKPRIKTLSEFDCELTSKFIDGMFVVVNMDERFRDLKLTPDLYFNWTKHITDEDLRMVNQVKFPEKDESYLRFRRTQPCIICGVQNKSEVHHLKHPKLCGLTQKSPDWATVSMCHECHLGIAHGTGFKERMKWLPLDMIDFLRLCYFRWKNLLNR